MKSLLPFYNKEPENQQAWFIFAKLTQLVSNGVGHHAWVYQLSLILSFSLQYELLLFLQKR